MPQSLKKLTVAAIGGLALAAAAPAAAGAASPTASAAPSPPAAPVVDPAVGWNRFLLDLQATPGVQPATIHPTYELAITQVAIYDAVAAIDRSGPQAVVHVHGPRRASVPAAADTAAHDALTALYPAQQAAIDQEYAGRLAGTPAGPHRDAGVRVGRRVAAELLERRADDGSGAAPPPFLPGAQPGDYQLTPPAFAQPVFTHWRDVAPFALRRADQLRPAPPAPLASPAYADAVNEVKTLGTANGSARTPDQTQIGLFWNPAIWATWNRIAQTAALAQGAGPATDARAFAALDLTLADSTIALYDAKYAYARWRPVTAIRLADTDGNPETTADPGWTPLSATAPDPSYPGAHATLSAAAADVLSSFYGAASPISVTSPATPGVERAFPSFAAAAQEASVSRIYNGNHTRLDESAGEELGHGVAAFVARSAFGDRGAGAS